VTAHADIADTLGPWFAERLEAPGARVVDLRRHTEGWSWQTYTLDVEWRSPLDTPFLARFTPPSNRPGRRKLRTRRAVR